MTAQTILVADDSPTIQRLVAQTFEGGSFVVVAVSDGDAAIEKFDEIRPSAVLADIYMPGKNGYEVCSFVKGHPVLDQTPVILFVGAFEAFDEDEAARVGASGKITKPFEPQELLDLVSGVIENPVAVPSEGGDPEDDILGLQELFPELPLDPGRGELSEVEIEVIADRVIQRLSSEVIEGIAWEVVPEIVDKLVREAIQKRNED